MKPGEGPGETGTESGSSPGSGDVAPEVARARVLCREGDYYGVVVDRPGPLGRTRLEVGEHRLHLMEVAELVFEGAELLSGPLEVPVSVYLTAVEGQGLSTALMDAPIGAAEGTAVVLEARGRYLVTGIRRMHGKRGPLTHLELTDRVHPELVGLMTVREVIARLLQPPGAALVVAKGESFLPVVIRLTTHLENQHENDLIGLPGCKGKWGKLDESLG